MVFQNVTATQPKVKAAEDAAERDEAFAFFDAPFHGNFESDTPKLGRRSNLPKNVATPIPLSVL